MNNAFFNISKKIANEFLQNIVFIDDKAYVEEGINNHKFDALKITKAFSDNEKICAVYQPESIKDIEQFSIIAQKADVVVLDWQIIIEDQQTPDEHESNGDEEDVKEEDTRGEHTRDIIKKILSPVNKDNLKLILIYTGETILPEITDIIEKDLETIGIKGI